MKEAQVNGNRKSDLPEMRRQGESDVLELQRRGGKMGNIRRRTGVGEVLVVLGKRRVYLLRL